MKKKYLVHMYPASSHCSREDIKEVVTIKMTDKEHKFLKKILKIYKEHQPHYAVMKISKIN